jgi:predicted amidohydrolase
MKLAYIQTNPHFLKVQQNLERIIPLIQQCPADLIVLPELFNTGYNFRSKQDLIQVAEPISGPTGKTLQSLARKHSCAIVAGIAEKSGKQFYNSALFITPSKIEIYRKIHLFANEKNLFSPGNLGFPVFRWNQARIGVMVCFDWFFPEAARTLTLKGAEILAHPSNLVMPYGPEAMKTRCLENHVYAVTANRVGSERNLTYIGQSQMVDPKGTVLKRASIEQEEKAILEVDLSLAQNKQLNSWNHVLKDRKVKTYVSF